MRSRPRFSRVGPGKSIDEVLEALLGSDWPVVTLNRGKGFRQRYAPASEGQPEAGVVPSSADHGASD